MNLQPLNAIVDVDCAAAAGWRPIDLAEACLAGGARFIQVRAKQASSAEMLELARAVVVRARRVGAQVIVNDRADVARLSGADGVHVGQDDLAPADVRRLLGPDAIVGLSTHTPEQVEAALEQPISYLAIGPVSGTATKATGYEAVGLDGVRAAAARAAREGVPVVAIGGVTLESAPDVLAAGAASVAVIADLLRGGQPEARVRAYLARLRAVPPAPAPRPTV